MIIAAIATMSSTFRSTRLSISYVKDDQRVWLRFEGPGKFHLRRWHIARPFTTGGWATLCGLVVRDGEIKEAAGDGPQCGTCVQVSQRQPGTYL